MYVRTYMCMHTFRFLQGLVVAFHHAALLVCVVETHACVHMCCVDQLALTCDYHYNIVMIFVAAMSK